MITVIEHKDYVRRVRDDRAESFIACLPCKGRGERLRHLGTIGTVWALGWQMTAWNYVACPYCGGSGEFFSQEQHGND